MGICISSAYSEIHGSEEVHENELACQLGTNVFSNDHDLGSAFSKQGGKGINQDAVIHYQGYGTEDGTFCGVFDGHGQNGHLVSQMVSSRLPLLILRQKSVLSKFNRVKDDDMFNQDTRDDDAEWEQNKDVGEWKEAILSAFKVMDKELKLQGNFDCSCSGTTAVVAIRQGEHVIVANLGDSRAILGTVSEGEVTAVQITTDLKPDLPSEADRIRKSNGRVFALKQEPDIQRVWIAGEDKDNSPGLAMSRALGDFLLKDYGVIAVPVISYHSITPTDQFLVLATDGVWDVLSNKKVASIVWRVESEAAAAKAVVEAANETWRRMLPFVKMDDCTALCLFLLQAKQCNPPSNAIATRF